MLLIFIYICIYNIYFITLANVLSLIINTHTIMYNSISLGIDNGMIIFIICTQNDTWVYIEHKFS